MRDGRYRVTVYCPDENVELGGDIPNTRGIGGGKTAIIKMAEALHRLGNDVRCCARCREGTFHGVEYVDSSRGANLSCDVLIAITGHKGDISELYNYTTDAKMKILWLSGAGFIKGIDDSYFDYYYANSVFLKKRAVREWHLPFEKVIATHQGFDPADFQGADGTFRRDDTAFVFASHPDKGLERVTEIVQWLRRDVAGDARFDVYGGYGLWNDEDTRVPVSELPWISYRGMLSQPELCKALFRYGFMLHLTDYEDTSSVLIHQAKRAGVIVIASDVGGNSEILQNGFDGFVISDHYRDNLCYERVRRLVEGLLADRGYAAYIRANAMAHDMTWDAIGGKWLEHWDEALGSKVRVRVVISGYYGFRNLGDEAILSHLVGDIRAVEPRADIAVVSGDPFFTEKLHGVNALPRDDFRLQAREVRGCDAVILGGGGLFHDHHRIEVAQFFMDHRFGVTSHANLPLLAKIYGKPLVYYSHGVGPLFSRESALFSKWAFGMADAISVRDDYSRDLLTEVLGIDSRKIRLSCDPVLRVQPPPPERARVLMLFNAIPRDKRLICVSLRYWIDKGVEQKVVREVSLALTEMLDAHRNYHVVLIPFQMPNEVEAEDDRTVCEYVSSRLPQGASSVVADYTTYEEVAALYPLAEFSIGMRYHSLVLSAAAGTPMIALSYDKKDDELMRDLGCDDLSIDVRHITHEVLLLNLAKVLRDLPSLRAKVQNNVTRMLADRGDTWAVLRI